MIATNVTEYLWLWESFDFGSGKDSSRKELAFSCKIWKNIIVLVCLVNFSLVTAFSESRCAGDWPFWEDVWPIEKGVGKDITDEIVTKIN